MPDAEATEGGALDADADKTGKSCARAVTAKPPVDIIIPIDQSRSMSDRITSVRANINRLSDNLEKTGLDYRVFVIARPGTTTVSPTYDVCVPAPLGMGPPTCASKPPTFRAVNRAVANYDTLKIILETYDAPLGASDAWADGLRRDAIKVFIPITDNDARATASDGTLITASVFDQRLMAKPGEQFGTPGFRRYLFLPICGASAPPLETKCSTSVLYAGAEYVALAKLTKGTWHPICQPDFGPVFEEMAKRVALRAACEFAVPPLPTGERLDPTRVNVLYTSGTDGHEEPIPRDDRNPCDSGADGWQFVEGNRRVVLCGPACTRVQNDSAAKVSVEFGCAPIVR